LKIMLVPKLNIHDFIITIIEKSQITIIGINKG